MNLKKIIALALVVCMVLSFFPASVFAEEWDEEIVLTDEEYYEEPQEEYVEEIIEEEPADYVEYVEPVEEIVVEDELPAEELPAEEPVVEESAEEPAAAEQPAAPAETPVAAELETAETFGAVTVADKYNADWTQAIDSYTNLQDALTAGGNIMLTRDVTDDVTVNGTVVFDANGLKVTGNITVNSGATFTMKNGTVKGSIETSGNTTLESVTVDNNNNTAITVNGGSLTIPANDNGNYGFAYSDGNVSGRVKGGNFTSIAPVLVAPGYEFNNGKVQEKAEFKNFYVTTSTGSTGYNTFSDAIAAYLADNTATLITIYTDGECAINKVGTFNIDKGAATITAAVPYYIDETGTSGNTYKTLAYAARIEDDTNKVISGAWMKTIAEAVAYMCGTPATGAYQIYLQGDAAPLTPDKPVAITNSTEGFVLRIRENTDHNVVPNVTLVSGVDGKSVAVDGETVNGVTTYKLMSTVAMIGTTPYASLRDAIEAAPDTATTISLVADDETSFTADKPTLEITKPVTIVGLTGDETISGLGDASNTIFVNLGENQAVTFRNVKISDFGTYAVYMKNANKGSLTLDNVTISGFDRTAVVDCNGVLTVRDSMITGNGPANGDFQSGVEVIYGQATITGTEIKLMGSKDGAWEAACVQLGHPLTDTLDSSLTLGAGNNFQGIHAIIVTDGTDIGSDSHPTGTLTITDGIYNGEILMVGAEATRTVAISGGYFTAPIKLAWAAQNMIPYRTTAAGENETGEVSLDDEPSAEPVYFSVKQGTVAEYQMYVIKNFSNSTAYTQIEEARDAGLGYIAGQDAWALTELGTKVVVSGAHSATLTNDLTELWVYLAKDQTSGTIPGTFTAATTVANKAVEKTVYPQSNGNMVQFKLVDARYTAGSGEDLKTYASLADAVAAEETAVAFVGETFDPAAALDMATFTKFDQSIAISGLTADNVLAAENLLHRAITVNVADPDDPDVHGALKVEAVEDAETEGTYTVTATAKPAVATFATDSDIRYFASVRDASEAAQGAADKVITVLADNQSYTLGTARKLDNNGAVVPDTGESLRISTATGAKALTVDPLQGMTLLTERKSASGDAPAHVRYRSATPRYSAGDKYYATIADAQADGATEVTFLGSNYATGNYLGRDIYNLTSGTLVINNVNASAITNVFEAEETVANAKSNRTPLATDTDLTKNLLKVEAVEVVPNDGTTKYFNVTLTVVAPVAAIGETTYPSIRAASEVAQGAADKVITVLVDGQSYQLGTARKLDNNGVVVPDTGESLRISTETGAKAVAVAPAVGKALKTEAKKVQGSITVAHNRYTSVTARYSAGENIYATLADAQAAGATQVTFLGNNFGDAANDSFSLTSGTLVINNVNASSITTELIAESTVAGVKSTSTPGVTSTDATANLLKVEAVAVEPNADDEADTTKYFNVTLTVVAPVASVTVESTTTYYPSIQAANEAVVGAKVIKVLASGQSYTLGTARVFDEPAAETLYIDNKGNAVNVTPVSGYALKTEVKTKSTLYSSVTPRFTAGTGADAKLYATLADAVADGQTTVNFLGEDFGVAADEITFTAVGKSITINGIEAVNEIAAEKALFDVITVNVEGETPVALELVSATEGVGEDASYTVSATVVSAVASIGTGEDIKYYATISAASEAASGATITVLVAGKTYTLGTARTVVEGAVVFNTDETIVISTDTEAGAKLLTSVTPVADKVLKTVENTTAKTKTYSSVDARYENASHVGYATLQNALDANETALTFVGTAPLGEDDFYTLTAGSVTIQDLPLAFGPGVTNTITAEDYLYRCKEGATPAKTSDVATAKLLNIEVVKVPADETVADSVDTYTATLTVVDPVASVTILSNMQGNDTTTYYPSIRAASEAANATYRALVGGAENERVITVLQSGLTYTLGSARNEDGTLKTNECIYIDRAGESIGVTVSDPNKYALAAEDRDDTDPDSTVYHMGEIIAVVDGVNYLSMEDAVEAANGEKLITLKKELPTAYTLSDELGEKRDQLETLIVGPTKFITVTNPDDEKYFIEKDPEEPGAEESATYSLKNLVATAYYVQNKDRKMKDFDSFSGAAGYSMSWAQPEESGVLLAQVAVYVEPLKDDIFELGVNEALLVGAFDSEAQATEVADTLSDAHIVATEGRVVRYEVEQMPDSTKWTISFTTAPVVATVTVNGTVTPYTSFNDALQAADLTYGRGLLTVVADVDDSYRSDLEETLEFYLSAEGEINLPDEYEIANEYVVGTGRKLAGRPLNYVGDAFQFAIADGVNAKIVGINECTVAQDLYSGKIGNNGEIVEEQTDRRPYFPGYFAEEFGVYQLVYDEAYGVYRLLPAAALVDFGEIVDVNEYAKKHNSFDWAFYYDYEEAIEAAGGEHPIFVVPSTYDDEDQPVYTVAPHAMSAGENIMFTGDTLFDLEDVAPDFIFSIEDKLNNKNYKKGYASLVDAYLVTDYGRPGVIAPVTIVNVASNESITITFDLGYTPDPDGSTYSPAPDPIEVAKGSTLPWDETYYDLHHQRGSLLEDWFDGDTRVVPAYPGSLQEPTVFTESTTLTAHWMGADDVKLTFVPMLDGEYEADFAKSVTLTAAPGDDIAERVAAIREDFEALETEHISLKDGWFEYDDVTGGYKPVKDSLDVMPSDKVTYVYALFDTEDAVITFVLPTPGESTETTEYQELGTMEVKVGQTIKWTDLNNKFKVLAEGEVTAYYDTDSFLYSPLGAVPVLTPGDATADPPVEPENYTVTATAVTLYAEVDQAISVGYFASLADGAWHVVFPEDGDDPLVIGQNTPVLTDEQITVLMRSAPTGKTLNPDDMWRVAVPDGERNMQVTEDGWSDKIIGSVTYVANWVYGLTVTVADGNTPLGTVQVYQGETLRDHEDELLALLTAKEGMTFIGWDFDLDEEIAGNMIVHALWIDEDEAMHVTWQNWDESEFESKIYVRNDYVKAPKADPTREGTNIETYVFKAWYLGSIDEANLVAFDNENYATVGGNRVVATKDLTFVPEFTAIASGNENVKYSYSISLEDSISVNFKVKNLPANTNLEDYSVVYTLNGVTGTAPLTNRTSNTIVVGKFAAKEVVDSVYVEVQYKGARINETDYNLSVKTYCDKSIENQTTVSGLCDTLLDYASYAQLRFNYKTDNLAKENPTDVSAVTVQKESVKKSGGATGITGISLSLALEAYTEMNFYFKHEEGANFSDYVFTLGAAPEGAAIEVAESGTDRYLVKVTGIAAKDLGQPVTVRVLNKTDSTEFEVTAPATLYMYLRQSTASEANVVKSLYRYYKAAESWAYPH